MCEYFSLAAKVKTSLCAAAEEEELDLLMDMELLELNESVGLSSRPGNSTLIVKTEVIPTVESPKSTSRNRRYGLRPKKHVLYDFSGGSPTDPQNPPSPAKKNLTTLKRTLCLETILETPEIGKNGSVVFLGKKKMKRFISFSDFVTKTKLKQRKVKVKRLNKVKGLLKKSKKPKITLEDVRQKLKSIEESNGEEEWVDISE